MGIHDSIDKLYIVQKKTIHEKTYHIYGALLQWVSSLLPHGDLCLSN